MPEEGSEDVSLNFNGPETNPMNSKEIINAYPNVSENVLFELFPRLPMSEYPSLSGYSWEDVHEGLAGQGGLFLAHDLAMALDLREGLVEKPF